MIGDGANKMEAFAKGVDDAYEGLPREPPQWIKDYGMPLISVYNQGYDYANEDGA